MNGSHIPTFGRVNLYGLIGGQTHGHGVTRAHIGGRVDWEDKGGLYVLRIGGEVVGSVVVLSSPTRYQTLVGQLEKDFDTLDEAKHWVEMSASFLREK